jgi:alkylation response protein AidB-like acyl-CoA dehydrogenase
MHFSLTADQTAFRDAVADLLAAQCPPAVVRGAPSPVWDRLAGMGLFGAAVPEPAGGLGLDEVDLVPVLMEIGTAAVPHPVAETMAVAAPLLAAVGDGRLAGVVAGATRVSLAGPDGRAPYLADLVLVVDDARVRLAPLASTVDVSSESTVDSSRPLTRLAPSAAPDDVLTEDPELVRLTRQRAELATAAQLIGLGRRMLALTTSYVGTRRQFGVPVGSFQAVKHRLADAVLRLEFATPTVLAAGWELATCTPDADRAVSLAAVLATEAATGMAKAAIQCHGAIGYTAEYDLQLYVKRAWALAATCDVDAHLNNLAAALDLGGPA